MVSTTLKLADNDEGLVTAALEIAQRRKDTLRRVKSAIRNRDLDEADRLITELVPDDKKVSRIAESKHGRTSSRR